MSFLKLQKTLQLVAFGIALTITAIAQSATVTWNVAGSGTWDTVTGNWTGGSPTANLYVNGDTAQFTNTAGGTITLSGTISPTATNVSATAGTYTFAGTGITTGTLIKSGAGTLTLTVPNSYTGMTTIQTSGTVNTTHSTLNLNSSTGDALAGDITLTTGAASSHAAMNNLLSNQIADTSVINFTGSGILGYWRLRGNTETVRGLSGSTGIGVIENGGFGQSINTNGTLTLDTAGNNYSFNGFTRNADSGGGTGTLAIVKTGSGTQTFAGNNINHGGGTTVNGGTLKWDLTARTGSLGGSYGVGSNGTLEFSNTNTGIDNVTGQLTATITGSGTINKTGTGYASIFGGNVSGFTGTINVTDGTLASNAGNWGTGTMTLNVAPGKTFDNRSNNVSVDRLTGSGTFTSTFNGSNTLTIGGADGTSTFSGAIENGSALSRPLTKTGTGTFTLSGSNTYTGLTSVSGGTLQLAKTASLYSGNSSNWTAANLNVKSGGTLAFNVGGTNEFTTGNVTTLLTNLAASSSATNGMNAGSNYGFDTTNAAGGTFTIADVLANSTGTSGGARGLTKLGVNTLVLTNTNTYSGPTLVSAGRLLVNGTNTGTGALNVANLATLGGIGSLAADVTLMSGGKLSPGASIESLATGSNIWNGGSLFDFEFSTDGNTGTAGNQWDLLSITGGLNLTGASSGSPVVFNLFTMANSTTPGFLGTWNPNVNHTWSGFLTTTTGVTGFASNKFSINTAGFQDTINGTFSVIPNGNNLDLVYTAVPEPGSFTMLFFASAMVWIFGRKRVNFKCLPKR